jgi:Ca2+/Na+ antiporter
MYFQSKVAAEQDAEAADATELVPLSQENASTETRSSSPINRSSAKASGTTSPATTRASSSDQLAVQTTPSAGQEPGNGSLDSPIGASDCRFFPRLSRSTSDLARLRRGASRSSLQSQQSTDSPRVRSSAASDPGFRTGGTVDSPADIESGSLIQDDVEAVAPVNIEGTTDSGGSTAHESIWHSGLMRVFHSMYTPVQHVIRSFMPALHPNIPHFITGNNTTISANRNPVVGTTQVSLRRAVLVLASCIFAIGVLAVSIVVFCENVIAKLGFSSTAMGATLVALGAEVSLTLPFDVERVWRATSSPVTVVGVYNSHAFSNVNVQIPDTVSAVALARSGYYNAAMAGAIGSQVPQRARTVRFHVVSYFSCRRWRQLREFPKLTFLAALCR